ncbi:ArnT family glycosyltransferase [Paenibacillus sacheonensis]|uniref:Dolichyl-phosphate-mannose--protein mannosyltransferase n=1 Tax=Paenibacillus sacheonensis TaxID=742054 RepID=A0A7X5C0G0_9BACL|nr:glycosyltransferase family 39 protein [Paenibacillus sacheonensis]MBM7566899.1 4-amino-4-deoxy-L-arabinose transferase-like glycosyltransferase [Paenibacillus sacheonensis]NBC71521.1 dolichyl-phosphate-mannose--protein mannosyltransferase [Paenibacillus sacheonensis]
MFSLRLETSRMRMFIWIVMAAVLLVHMAVVLWLGDHFLLGSYELRNNDDVKYVYSAQVLVEQGTLVYNSGMQPTNFIMPAIPVMLSGFMTFLERDAAVMGFRLLQCFMQAASVYLIFVLARETLGRRVAVAAVLLDALYIPNLFASGAILTESTFKLLFLLLIASFLYAVKRRTAGAYVFAGIMLGLACYVKPQCALIPVCLLILWLVRNYSWGEIVKYTAIVAACSMLLLTPWWIRNYNDFHAFIPFTKSTGNPMLLGALIERAAPPKGFFEQYPEYKGDSNNLFAGYDTEQKRTAKRLIAYGFKHQTLDYTYWFTVGKSIQLFENPFYSRPVPGLPRPAINVVHWIYVLAGFAGILLTMLRRRFKLVLPILLPFVYYWFIHLPFITFGRYGYPLMCLMSIFAAFAIVSILEARGVLRGREEIAD